jgi:hypothetical protein
MRETVVARHWPTIAAIVGATVSVIFYWKNLFAKFDLQSPCAYLSLGLPILGLVAYRSQTVEISEEGLEEERAAKILQDIESEKQREFWENKSMGSVPPALPASLSSSEFLLAAAIAPQKVFREIEQRLCLEALAFPMVFLVCLPLVLPDRSLSVFTNYLVALIALPFYELGKAMLFLIAARLLGSPCAFRSALFSVLILDLSPAVMMLFLLLFPAVISSGGQILDHLFGLWSFILWWVALAMLSKIGYMRSLFVAMGSYAIAHFLLCPALRVGRVLVTG